MHGNDEQVIRGSIGDSAKVSGGGAGAFGAFVNIQDVTARLNGPSGFPPMFSATRA